MSPFPGYGGVGGQALGGSADLGIWRGSLWYPAGWFIGTSNIFRGYIGYPAIRMI